MTVYRSKIGYGLLVPILILLASTLTLAIYNSVWFSVTVVTLVALFVLYTFLNTYYVIDGDKLRIRCGFFRSSIDIETIKLIKKTNSILSAPAASLDRILIRYNKYGTLVISPKNKTEFIEHLQKLNTKIEVQIP